MNKNIYRKYNHLSHNTYIYQKILKIKNLSERERYIDNIYYPIIDTIFLIKFMNHELGNYRNIFKIKINFNIFTLTADIKIYKIKKQGYLETLTIIDIFNNMNYKRFDQNFILNQIVYNFDNIKHLDMLPILLKCRSRLKEEYMIFVLLIYSIFLKGKFYLPKDIIKNIIGFII